MTITRADDALKYAAAMLKFRTDWTLDCISGSGCDQGGHETQVDAIDDIVGEIVGLAAQFGDRRRYSDGRLVESSAEICPGLMTTHIWHPDPGVEQPTFWRACLPSDPGVPSPGLYEVSTDPLTQDIHVRMVRSV